MLSATGTAAPDLWEILGRFDHALSLVIVCHQSLAAKESAEVGDEQEVLRQSIRLLREVHKELDRGAALVKRRAGRAQSSPRRVALLNLD